MTMPETTQSDLVERLRDYAPSDGMFIRCHNRSTRQMNADIRKAADEIERLQKIESQMDGGRFDEWPTATFVGQLRMQARDSLDLEYSQFMAATATHLGLLSGQYDAQREIAERAKADAARLRAQCEAMAKAVETFTNGYLLDERDQPELCLDIEHHDAVVALFDALAAYGKEGGA
jgi:hypothetical protein